MNTALFHHFYNRPLKNMYAKWMSLLLALLATCLVTLPASALQPAEPPFELRPGSALFFENVAYGPDERHRLDIFVPQARREPTPLVIFIHGGGFTSGSKEMAYRRGNRGDIETFLAHGIAYASIDYPLLDRDDDQGMLKSLHGARRALQFLRHNHAGFNIDPSRVVLMGSSAGASTALWLAFHDDMANPNSRDLVEWQSTRVLAAVALEVQASLDIVRWEEVFRQYHFSALSMDNAEKFYGIGSLQQLYAPSVVAYRQEVDLLRLMDRSDPEVWVSNENVPVTAPTSTRVLYHHPYHARALRDQAASVGLRGTFYIPQLGIMPSPRESMVEFVLRKVG